MELADLQELITHPESLDEGTLPQLKELLEQYPYFQTAWVLYLKNLYKLGDPTFKEELRKGSLYVADLSVLFYYIEGERFLIQKHKVDPVDESDSASDRTLDLIDRFLSDSQESSAPSTPVKDDIPVPVEMPGDYTSVLLSEVSEEEETATTQLHGHELIDQFIEDAEANPSDMMHEIMSEERTPSESGQQQETETTEEHPVEEETVPSEEEEGPEESYFTETLAKIYVRQQRYDKALEIIKKLNLKYPKKNAYFADQIRFLEKLIINAKSK